MKQTGPNVLMMIEPTGPAEPEIHDQWTRAARRALDEAEPGKERWRGWHTCECGARSSNRDLYVRGMKANSLLVHYVKEHRSEVPDEELEKLRPWLS